MRDKKYLTACIGALIVLLLELSWWTLPLMAGQSKQDNQQEDVGICHKCGQEWIYKLVKESSLQGHLQHGDFLYKGRPDVEPWEMDDWCNLNAEAK